MSNPFPLVILVQCDPATAARVQSGLGGGPSGPTIRFGRRGPRLNAEPDGKSYTIQVKDTETFDLVKRVLTAQGAGRDAWVSVDSGSGPQWVPLSRFTQG